MERRKLDPRLIEEVERRKVSDSAEPLHVVITCSDGIHIPQGLTGSRLGAYIDSEAKAIQGPVIKELKNLGIRSSKIKPVRMSNCIEAHVSISQLIKIEKLESVASIRFSSLDHVAL